MRGQRILVRGMVMATAAGAAMVGARRRADRRAADAFYEVPLKASEPDHIGAGYGGSPIYWHRSEWIEALHTASMDRVRDVLPSDDLYPVRLPNGRAVVYVAGSQYGDITANGVDGLAALPYGEVWVNIAVTRRPAPPFVPLVAPAATGLSAGWFVLHLPVTTKVARDVGRLVWGYPKFIADMDFDDSINERRVRLAEGGRSILSLTVWPSGRPAVTHETVVLYSVLDGRLIEAKIPTYGLAQTGWGRSGGRLELGDHPLADELRRLDIAAEPFMTRLLVGHHIAMGLGRPVGPARPYRGYAGDERELGRYVVHYPGTAPVDRYAPYAPTAGPRGGIGGTPLVEAVPSAPELVNVSG